MGQQWTVRFNPQMWRSDNYAVDVPPLGGTEFPIDDAGRRSGPKVALLRRVLGRIG